MSKQAKGYLAVEWEAEHSSGMYYMYACMGILVGLCFIGYALVMLLGPAPAYLSSPTAADSLMLDGKEHLARPCAVVNVDLVDRDKKSGRYEFYVGTKHLKAFEPTLPAFKTTGVDAWPEGKAKGAFTVQLYKDEDGDFTITKIYDPVAKKIIETSDTPQQRLASTWRPLKIGLLILAGCAVWIYLGRFAQFSNK
jgi:hypothetical protein